MNKIAILLGALATVSLLGLVYKSYNSESLSSVKQTHLAFIAFKQQYGRSYKSVTEQLYRFKVFTQNLKLIDEINSDSRNTYTAAVNQFADMTFAELSSFYLSDFSQAQRFTENQCTDHPHQTLRTVPDSFNWVDQKKVQAVKNQGNCGSCWAFSAVGSIESALAIKGNCGDPNSNCLSVPNISEQELVDCSQSYGNQGCNGGLMNSAFDYVIEHHINDESAYPYAGRDQQCKTPQIGEGKNSIVGCVKADPSIDGLVNAIAVQPTSVAFHVTNGFFFYHGGVYNPWFCIGEPNHGVLAVGYNKTDKTPFYIVKNSWGASWGESGFFRIAFGKGQGTCKIAGNGFNYYPLA